MPRVPIYETAKVDTRPLPTPMDTVRPVETGALVAQAGAQLARGLESLATDVDRVQAQADGARVNEEKESFNKKQRAAIYDTTTGALSLRGKDAHGSADKALANIDGWSKETESTLRGARQIGAWRVFVEAQRKAAFSTVSAHEAAQLNAYDEGLHNAVVSEAASRGASAYQGVLDPKTEEAIDAQLQAGVLEIQSRGRHQGWGEATKDKERDFRTALHLGVLRNMAAKEDAQASEYLAKHRDEIDGQKLDDAEKLAKGASLKAASRAQVSIYLNLGITDPQEQLDLARRLKDTALSDATVDRLKQMHEEDRKLTQERDGEILDRVNLETEKTGRVDTTNQDFLDLSPGGQDKALRRLRAIKYEQGRLDVEQRRQQHEANELALQRFRNLGPKEQAGSNLREFDDVDTITRERLVGMQKTAKENIDKGQLIQRENYALVIKSSAKGIASKAKLATHEQFMWDEWVRYPRPKEQGGEGRMPTQDDAAKIANESRRRVLINAKWAGIFPYTTEVERHEANPKDIVDAGVPDAGTPAVEADAGVAGPVDAGVAARHLALPPPKPGKVWVIKPDGGTAQADEGAGLDEFLRNSPGWQRAD